MTVLDTHRQSIATIEERIVDAIPKLGPRTSNQHDFDVSFTEALKLDGFDIVELIMKMEETFHFEIPAEHAEKIETPKELIEYIAFRAGLSQSPIFLQKPRLRYSAPQDGPSCARISVRMLGVVTAIAIASTFFIGKQLFEYLQMPLTVAIIAVAIVATIEALPLAIQALPLKEISMRRTSSQSPVNFHISGGNVSNINLGKVFGDMRSRIEVSAGPLETDQLSNNIIDLSKIVETSPFVSAENKVAAAEHFEQILDEQKKPEAERRRGIVLSSIDYLTKILGATEGLTSAWSQTEQVIRNTFGI